MTNLDRIATEALALSPEMRARLAEILIQSLDEPEDEAIRSSWIAEIGRRDQEIRSGEAVCRPADEVLREARKRLRSRE